MAGHFGKHKELTTSLDSLQRIGYLWDVFLPQTFGNAKLPSAGSNWSPQREVFESLEDQPGSRTGMYNSYHHIEWINHHKFTHVYRGYMCHMYIPFFSLPYQHGARTQVEQVERPITFYRLVTQHSYDGL